MPAHASIAVGPDFVQARAPFSFVDSVVGLVRIEDGEFVVAGHEAVTARPELFRRPTQKTARRTPRPITSAGRKGVRRGPGDPAPRPAGRTSPKVVFTADGWADLRREILEWCDGREGGGGLYGHVDADGTIVVDRATGCGLYAERDSVSIELDRAWLLKSERPGVVLVGDWHSHEFGGAVQPSGQDMHAWRGSIRRSLDRHAGVIVTPTAAAADDSDRWWNAHVHAWVARSDGTLKLATVERS